MKSMPISRADVQLRLSRWEGGYVVAYVGADLPGCEPADQLFKCDLAVADEVYSCMGDFHNEWKSWGSLMDCVLDDWLGAQQRR